MRVKKPGAWHDRLVLVFRNQQLSMEQQIAFAQRFGALQKVRTTAGVSHDNSYVMMVSNVDIEGKTGVLPEAKCSSTRSNAITSVPAS